MFRRQAPHRFNLHVRSFHRAFPAAAKKLWLNPDRKELSVEPAFFGAFRVEVSIREALFEIYVFINETLCRVGMHIDDDGPPVNCPRIVRASFVIRHIVHSVSFSVLRLASLTAVTV